MTAFEQHPADADARVEVPAEMLVSHVERIVLATIDGRRAARRLAGWLRRFEIAEADFQVLWCLRGHAPAGRDQTALARELVFSPAQVSATVERMRAKGWICQCNIQGDRRRHLWQLSTGGNALIDEMLRRAGEIPPDLRLVNGSTDAGCRGREVAA